MSELSIVDPPESTWPQVTPPVNPFYCPPKDEESKEGTVLVLYNLDEGPVLLEWPDELSQDSVEDFEYWVAGLINRAKRKAGMSVAT